MKSIETSIIIEAPAAKVWQTLMNFPAYPSWNPFIQKINGNPKPGETLEVDIHPPGKQMMTFHPIVLVSQVEQEFRWIGKAFVKGLFDGEHYFKLSPINEQQTRLDHGEQFSGLLSGLLFAMIGASTRSGFEAMNQALKDRAEA